MAMSVKCPCGRAIPVSAGQAGAEVVCSCGQAVRVPLLTELRRASGEASDPSELAQALHAMLTDDPAPKPMPRLGIRVAKALLGVFLVFVLIGIAQLIIAFEARRLQTGQVAPSGRDDIESSEESAGADLAKIREFVRIYAESKEESWAIVEPLNAYFAGEIDADQLVHAVAEPAESVHKKYTRMMAIARSLGHETSNREALVELSRLVISRHRGLMMMLEAIANDDSAKTEVARRIMRDAQLDILRLSADNLPDDSEEAQRLRDLLQAQEGSRNDAVAL